MRPNQGAVPNFNFAGPRDARGGALRHDSRHGDGDRLSGGCVEAFEWAGHARDTCKHEGGWRNCALPIDVAPDQEEKDA